MYDVFLSHNRIQKPWVRRLYEFLVKQGLSVFFDELSILPGANILSSIEQGIEQSRYIILILSPSSLNSKWVGMETQFTIHNDPNARLGSLVPVIIEKIDPDKLRLSVRTLNCIDLTKKESRLERLKLILKHIGVKGIEKIPSEELQLLLSFEDMKEDNSLNVAGVDEVIEWGWDGIKLLEEFIHLDYQTVEDLVPAHEGQPEQWAPIFMHHPDSWRMLISSPEKIVGYWHFAPLFPEEFKLAINGILFDSQITADKIQIFELPGIYDIYFVQICLLPNYRTPKNVKLLFETFFSVLDNLSSENIFFRNICANAYTKSGHSLCKTFGLKYTREHHQHGSIYLGSIYDLLKTDVASSFTMLKKKYTQRNIITHSIKDS